MKNNYNFFTYFIVFCFLSSSMAWGQQPQEVGQWSDPIPFNLIPVAVANLPDGRLLTWSSRFRESRFDAADGFTYTEIFDPNVGVNGQAMGLRITDNNHNMFCPGINNLADGRIFVAGGGSAPRTTIYDPQTETWIPSDNMNVARAYQGNVTLANGEVFTIGGQWDGGSTGKIGEIWTPENGWKRLPGIPMEVLFNNNDLQGGHNRPADHAWVWSAPNGKVFHAGPSEDMHWLDVNGNGSVTFSRKRDNDPYSISGTTVMYDIGKILKVGGAINYGNGAPASENSYIIDINNENNVIVTRTANDIAFSRTHHNSVVLPNGEVLIVGGLSTARTFFDGGSRFLAELWNPQTNRWRTVAGMQVPRNYHSVSILMQDGRVFTGGGGLCGGCSVNHEDAEIYSPPYLFDSNGNLAVRPEISAPGAAQFNQVLQVQSDDTIEAFSFIRMSSATHSVNNEQRRVPVSFSRNGNTYSLNVPGANVMPPGYYMLFAMDQNGVPSIAESVQVVPGIVSVTGVEINPNSIELAEGRVATLTEIVSPSDASDRTVSWSSADTNIATVDANGLVSAVAVGTTTITVTTNDGGFTAQTNVTVVEGDGLCIASGTILMERYDGIGGVFLDELFNAPNFPDNPSSTQELDSFEIPTNVANDYGVKVSGYLCAPETGTYYFWVAGDDESRLNLSTDNEVSNIVTIANVPDWTSSRQWNKFSEQKSVGIQLIQGLSYYIEAFMKEGGGGDNLAVGWRKPSDGNGSSPTQIIPGSVLSPILELAPVDVTGVTVTPSTLDLIVGNGSQLTASVEPANADDSSISWSSSDEGVATVDGNGQVTAIDEGLAIITVTTNDGGFEATATITVERAPVFVTGVTLNVNELNLTEGETANLTATVNPSDADDTTVVWSSSDESVATVDENGQVSAVSEGTATILVTTNDGGFEAQVEVVVSAIEIPKPTQSSPIIVDSEMRRVWMVNPDNNTVAVLDADSLELLGEFAVDKDPVSISKDGQGNIWVTCRDAGTIQVINPTGNILNTINLGRGSQPYAVVNDPQGEFLYVTLFASNKVLKINSTSQAIVDELLVFAKPRAMAITSDGAQLFVTQFITENNQGKIAKIDLVDFELNSNVNIEADTFSPNSSSAAKGIANYLGGIAIQPNNDRAWFTAKKDNVFTGAFKSGLNLEFATTVRALVSNFSIETGVENAIDRVDIDNHSVPTGITISPSGDYVFVTMLANNRIIVLNANNGLEVTRQDVGFAPSGIAIDPATNRLFVKNFLSRSVHVFDADALIGQGNQTLPLLSEISTVSNELLANQVLQGKQIFYNARDNRMALQENSDAGYISCASCHIDGTYDGQTWDFTQRGEGLRNTISLRGRSGTAHGNVHWTGNFDEIHDFENDIRFAFGGKGFMTDQDFFSENRESPLGGAKAGQSAELDALTAYIESLDSFDESPNKNENGTMTSEALQGRTLFNTLQCANCHSGEAFTNSASGLLYDIGTINNGSGKRLGRTLQGFDVPTLRDAWATAPYLHDGSAATVKDAIAQHAVAANLSQGDLELLEAYVLQLDGLEPPASAGITFELQVPSTATLSEQVSLSVSTNIPNIQEVIYFVDDVEIGRSSSAPYNLNFIPQLPNNFCIYAKAVHEGMGTVSRNQTLTVTGDENNSGGDRLISLEGEDFVSVEDGSIGNYLPGFRGVGFLDLSTNSSSAEWQFQSEEEVTANLTIVYSNGFLADRLARLEINGNNLGTIVFPTSANCFSWQSIQLEDVQVQEGSNTIKITTTSIFGGVDIDFLEVELPQVARPVTGVTVAPTTLALTEGQTGSLTATVSPAEADDQTVTWSSSDEAVATVDTNGEVTAVSEGTATIIVTTNDGGFEATSTITVERALVPVTGVTVAPTTLALTEGQTGSLTATVSPAEADDQTVTWSSSDEAVATVDANGEVTAVSEGTATITATTNDGGFEATAEVTVNAPAASLPWVEDFTGLANGSTVDTGETAWDTNGNFEVLNGMLRYELDFERNFPAVWTSEEVDISGVGSVSISLFVDDEDLGAKEEVDYLRAYYILDGGTRVQFAEVVDDIEGQVLSLNGLSGSTVRVELEAKSSADNERFLVDNIEIRELIGGEVPVTGITIDSDALLLPLGGSSQLVATVSPLDATDQAVSWSSSDDTVATVDTNGNVTAVSEGTAVITATTNDGGFTATAEVTVRDTAALPWSEDFTGLANGSTVDTGETAWSTNENFEVLNGMLRYEIDYNRDFPAIWTSEEVDISGAGNVRISLTVDDEDLGAKEDTDYLRAYYILDGGTRVQFAEVVGNIDSQELSVEGLTGSTLRLELESKASADNERFLVDDIVMEDTGGGTIAVTGVTVAPTELDLLIGGNGNLTATISPVDATDQTVSWSSSDDTVATVGTNGEVTAVSEGTATITATTNDGGFEGTATITVNIPVVNVTGVTVAPTELDLLIGGNGNLTATVSPVDATDQTVSWSSSDDTVATVGTNGEVTAVSEGTATITATTNDGGFEGTATITVNIPSSGLPWSEDFTGLSDGTTIDTGATAWSTNENFEVRNGKLRYEIDYDRDFPATWASQDIDISGATNVSIRLTVDDEDLGAKEPSDYLRAYYVLDGQRILFGEVVDDIDTQILSVNGLNGTVLRLELEAKASADNERFLVDDIEIFELLGDISVTGVTLDVSNMLLTEGETGNLVATVSPGDATDQTVVWESSDVNVASVDGNGLVTAVSEGTATITVTTNDGGFVASATVTVTAPSSALPWLEDFNDLGDGATIDTGTTSWSTNENFEVRNGKLRYEIDYNRDFPATWASQEIDISGATSVSIRLTVDDEDLGAKEPSDYLRAYFILDGSRVPFGEVVGNIEEQELSMNGLSGNTLRIELEAKASADNERFLIDDIEVSADAPLAIKGTSEELSSQVLIFPNPNDGRMNLDLRSFDGIGVSVVVFNNLQQQVFEIRYGENHALFEELDVSNLANGVYHFVIGSEAEQTSKTIIIAK